MWKCVSCSEMNPDSTQFCQSCGDSKKETSKTKVSQTSNNYTSTMQTSQNASGIIVTTTAYVEGKKIKEYIDVVSGTDIYLVGGVFGGGLVNQENLYGSALTKAKSKMKSKALALGADAIVGVQVAVVSPGELNDIIVIVNGTAVKLEG